MIKEKVQSMGIEIDLTGPQGNAFYLMGTAKNLCKQLGYDSKPVIDDMKAGDYNNLISVFDKHFGDFVTLYK
mgnify:FL=1|tara:strand:- start:3432 stop:3647 length:216 start_codon:yes stop_codon:yes gene_type:complete